MTKSVVNVHEAKTHLSRLLERVEAGEEIDLARRGTIIATLVPARRPAPTLGTMPGIVIGDDFDAPLPADIADAFGGVRVLLDTHVVLWALTDPDRLGSQRQLVADPEVTRLLSAAVVWEVAIKVGLGRLDLGVDVDTWAGRARTALVAEAVPVTAEHAAAVATLPRHHRDPFDRILVAQARAMAVPVLSADAALEAYDIVVLPITRRRRP